MEKHELLTTDGGSTLLKADVWIFGTRHPEMHLSTFVATGQAALIGVNREKKSTTCISVPLVGHELAEDEVILRYRHQVEDLVKAEVVEWEGKTTIDSILGETVKLPLYIVRVL